MSRLVLVLALLCSCSDDAAKKDVDLGGVEAGVDGAVDSGVDAAAEAGLDAAVDQSAVDGPVSACDPSLDLTPLSLDTGFCVVRRFDLPTQIDAVGLRGTSVYVFSLDTAPTGKVSQATIDPVTGKPGAYTSLFTFTPGLSGTLFASAYLALSPGGYAAAGYTVDTTYEGQVFWGNKGTGAPNLVDKASGNFDVVFLDNQTMLINGTGVGTAQDGQGVYLYQQGKTPRRLITDLGVASGFVAVGKKAVFAGGYFTGGSKIYGFSVAEVQSAIAGGGTLTPTADGDLILDGSAGDAAALEDELVVVKLDSSWAFDGVARIPVTVSGNTVTPGAPVDLVTKPGGATATVSGLATGSGQQLGLVLQGTGQSELVIVEPK